ncbi:hypothetical protein Taro_041775 [Colocasia esculenta]|uniref:Uncharacterized protein n=1 Tax=Colocasia esculenta TaxID=4460 RepID=A0A843WY68_COLES|nr:hypothetical protein [Colocasia esculenta]
MKKQPFSPGGDQAHDRNTRLPRSRPKCYALPPPRAQVPVPQTQDHGDPTFLEETVESDSERGE